AGKAAERGQLRGEFRLRPLLIEKLQVIDDRQRATRRVAKPVDKIARTDRLGAVYGEGIAKRPGPSADRFQSRANLRARFLQGEKGASRAGARGFDGHSKRKDGLALAGTGADQGKIAGMHLREE